MTKRIVLCADDYGQAEAISNGILDLVDLGRLSAVSCMVNQPRWHEQAVRLAPYRGKIDIGLHLNFTEGEPLSGLYREKMGSVFKPVSAWLWRSRLFPFSLDQAALTAEINAQLTRFQEGMGFIPRFLDGHQHIHHLPGVRDALLTVYQKRLQAERPYLRVVTPDWRWSDVHKRGFKALVLHLTGGREFAKRLDSYSIPHNTSFAGLYQFGQSSRYRDLFQQFMRLSRDRGMIMCHPGLNDADSHDAIGQARYDEYQYFKSDDFTADCKQYDVILSQL